MLMEDMDPVLREAALAAYQRFKHETRSVATKEGLARRRALGKPTGPAPLGWSNRNNGRRGKYRRCWIVRDRKTREIGDACASMIRSGMSITEVYRSLMPRYRSLRKKGPIPRSTIVRLASRSTVGWPPISDAVFLANFPLAHTVKFIRS